MAKEERNVMRPEGIKQANLTPNKDAEDTEELINAEGGTRRAVGAMPVGRQMQTRVHDNPVNYHRGLFAIMAAYDWDAGKFSERLEDVALRNEGFELLGLPASAAATINPDSAQMAEFVQYLSTNNETRSANARKSRGKLANQEVAAESLEERNKDYVKNLIKLSQTVSKNRNPKDE